jgi:hypothetical protein
MAVNAVRQLHSELDFEMSLTEMRHRDAKEHPQT